MKKFYFLTLALICAFVANAADVYLRGGHNDWGTDNQWKFTQNGTTWTLEVPAANMVGKEFKIADAEWKDINLGGAGTSINLGQNYNLSKDGGNMKLANVGGYNMLRFIVTNQKTLKVEGFYLEQIYILGNVDGNDWSTSKGPGMSHQGEGVYTISGVTINGADGGQYGYFSFAAKLGAGWPAVNAGTRWGPNAKDKQVVLGTDDTDLTNTWAGGTMSWKIEPGVYDMKLNTKELTLLVNQSVVATPVITMDENDMISITCATEGATIYYTIDGTTPTTSSTQYTGDFKLTVDSLTVKAIAVKDGWANSATASEAFVPTAIEEVGVDAGETVYYNLQGVKVANPENGIFIKKQGNKTTKVVL